MQRNEYSFYLIDKSGHTCSLPEGGGAAEAAVGTVIGIVQCTARMKKKNEKTVSAGKEGKRGIQAKKATNFEGRGAW